MQVMVEFYKVISLWRPVRLELDHRRELKFRIQSAVIAKKYPDRISHTVVNVWETETNL
jgi:hypothetical protein